MKEGERGGREGERGREGGEGGCYITSCTVASLCIVHSCIESVVQVASSLPLQLTATPPTEATPPPPEWTSVL